MMDMGMEWGEKNHKSYLLECLKIPNKEVFLGEKGAK
jgi:hypothetical protein